MCGSSATGILSPAPGRGCAYIRYCVFPRSQNLCGIAGSCDFRRCTPVALCVCARLRMWWSVSVGLCVCEMLRTIQKYALMWLYPTRARLALLI